MKKVSKADLQKTAKKVFFDKIPGLSIMYATEDGNFFYPHAFNAAASHANGGKIHTLNRNSDLDKVVENASHGGGEDHKVDDNNKIEVLNAKDTAAAIKAIGSLEALNAFADKYKVVNDDRSTVKTAYDKRLKQLTPVGDPGGSKDVKTSEELVIMIGSVKEEKDLDELEAKFDLSKHESAEVVKAFETKESEFLDN